MKRLLVVLLVLAALGGVVFWLLTMPPKRADLAAYTPDAANGRTMFYAGGCASCHMSEGQPKESENRELLGGGHGLASPFGTFHAPNISPDPKAGIGSWSEGDFVAAMMQGVSPSGGHYYPAFPYASYQSMRLEDVRDLWAFMKTLPKVETANKPHEVGFPFTLRRGIGLWKLAFMGAPRQVPAGVPADVARGFYLVNGPGHCAECHSPRNFAGGIDEARRFAGGQSMDGKGWVPNLTPHEDGLKAWSAADISYFLETGSTPDGDSAGGTMASVVKNMAQLSDPDRKAIAAYLKSLPPVAGKAPKKAN